MLNMRISFLHFEKCEATFINNKNCFYEQNILLVIETYMI